MKLFNLRLAVLSVISAVALAGAAFAGGAFQGYPVVGNDGTVCLSTGNNGVCNQLQPLGPSRLTGAETFPADTNTTNNSGPYTVDVPMAAIGAGPHQYAAPLTGATLTLTNVQRRLILEPAGTIAALTVVFPAIGSGTSLLIDNQLMGICTTQIVTALTVTAGTGTTVNNAPTALLVPVATGGASCVEWVYRLSNTTWYRVQ